MHATPQIGCGEQGATIEVNHRAAVQVIHAILIASAFHPHSEISLPSLLPKALTFPPLHTHTHPSLTAAYIRTYIGFSIDETPTILLLFVMKPVGRQLSSVSTQQPGTQCYDEKSLD